MKKIHIAIATQDIEASIKEYTLRLGTEPCSFVNQQYALWRTETINFSVRYDLSATPGELRHLGWEDDTAPQFSEETDVNNIVWEAFSAQQQAAEINQLWPEAQYSPS